MAHGLHAVVAVVLVFSVPASAQPQLALFLDPKSTRVDSPDRLDETLEQAADPASVITRREIELRGQPFVSDLLRTVAGVDVVQTGARGGTTSVYIRGTESSHALVLLDGVPLNDPSDPSRAYDLANLTTDDLERIEILRGPQSVLYGSDAIGGVISLVTRKGEGPAKLSLYGEGGAYDTTLGRAGLSGATKSADYSIAASRFKTGGIPSAGSDYGNTLRSGYNDTVLSGRVGLTPIEGLRLALTARNTYARYQVPFSGGPGGDDPDYRATSSETDASGKAALDSFHGKLVQSVFASFAAQDRRFHDDPDYLHPFDSSQSSSDGRTVKLSYQAALRLHESDTLTFGVDRQRETARTDYTSQSFFGPYSSVFGRQRADSTGVFAEDLLSLGGRFILSAGVRRDRNYRFGSADSWRLAPAVLIPETRTKLRASLGTGFKSPTLFQLYSQYGATDLHPERSLGMDAGFEQDFFDGHLSAATSWFRNDLRDLIDFNDATFVYFNVGRVRTEGYETSLQARPTETLALRGQFTYTSAKDLSDGSALLRRPRLKFNGDVERRLGGATAGLGSAYTGPRTDIDFSTGNRVVLGGYALWRVFGSYALARGLTFTARIDNLLNKRYEEVQGYGTLGIAGYAGVQWDF